MHKTRNLSRAKTAQKGFRVSVFARFLCAGCYRIFILQQPLSAYKKSDPCCSPVQNFIEPGKEGDGGDGGGQNVADRLGQKHTEHLVRQHQRQNENERDQQDELAQAGQQQAHLGLPQRHKALLASDLEAHGKNAGHVNAHGPCGVLDQRTVRSKDARHRAGKQHHQKPEDAGVRPA